MSSSGTQSLTSEFQIHKPFKLRISNSQTFTSTHWRPNLEALVFERLANTLELFLLHFFVILQCQTHNERAMFKHFPSCAWGALVLEQAKFANLFHFSYICHIFSKTLFHIHIDFSNGTPGLDSLVHQSARSS